MPELGELFPIRRRNVFDEMDFLKVYRGFVRLCRYDTIGCRMGEVD